MRAVGSHDPTPGSPRAGVAAAAPVGAPRRSPAAGIPVPIREALAQAAGMTFLAAATARALLTPPYGWGSALIEQMWVTVSRCLIPLSLSVFFFGFGAIGVQAGLVFDALGAADRTGQLFVTGAVRELATWATAMIVAGVAGTAVTADLGARKIREELDAMRVIGVNPLRSLVLPRVAAMVIVTPLLNMIAILACTLAGVFATQTLFDTTLAAFVASFAANFSVPELLGSVIKTTIFGAIIGVVCCYKGLTAKGGPQGVGRAVNQAVVIAFAALWVFNYAFTSVLLASYPELQGLR